MLAMDRKRHELGCWSMRELSHTEVLLASLPAPLLYSADAWNSMMWRFLTSPAVDFCCWSTWRKRNHVEASLCLTSKWNSIDFIVYCNHTRHQRTTHSPVWRWRWIGDAALRWWKEIARMTRMCWMTFLRMWHEQSIIGIEVKRSTRQIWHWLIQMCAICLHREWVRAWPQLSDTSTADRCTAADCVRWCFLLHGIGPFIARYWVCLLKVNGHRLRFVKLDRATIAVVEARHCMFGERIISRG